MDNNNPQGPLFNPDGFGLTAEEQRAQFIRKTYTHVALAVGLFIVVETLLLRIPAVVEFTLSLTQGWKWLVVLGLFMLGTNYAHKLARTSHSKTTQYAGLGLYVLAQAVIFVPLIYIAMQIAASTGENLITQAAITSLALFTGLSAIVFFTKKDFSFLRSTITILSFVALGLIIAGMLFGFNLGLLFSGGMVVLASLSILYETSQLNKHYGNDQYVGAALGIFSSLMLLFWYILRIFMSRD